MADEKVNMSPEERKTPEAPAPSGPGDPPAPEHTEGPAVPGGDQAAPAHVGPATPEQSVIPGMGEDAPAPSGKVINLSDIQAADKGSKEASAPAPDKKAPEADKPPKRRGRPPKEQAGPTAEKKAKNIQTYFDQQDWKNYAVMVHAVKSTSRMIGAAALSDLAYILERAADEENLTELDHQHMLFLAEYKAAAEAISSGISHSTEPPEEEEIIEFFPEQEKG